MKRLLPALSFLLCTAAWLAAPSAFGASDLPSSIAEYMKVRKSFGITQAVGIQALETLIGARVLEFKGLVKGSMAVGDSISLLVERTDGQTMVVEGKNIPGWLNNNEVSARLLVRAERQTELGELRARLIAAAPEADVAAAEMREAALARAAAKKKAKPSSKPPVKDNNPLRGPIGRQPKKKDTRQWMLSASDALPYYTAYIMKRNRRLSQAQAEHIAKGVIGFSIDYGVDARLIMAMVMVESGFNPNATSRAGAQGLGQLMPGTSRGMGITNAYDTMQNLYGTVRKVRGHLDQYKKKTGDEYESLVLTLAAYNAGGGAVRRHGGVPPYRETRNYIQKVISLYNKLCGA